MKASKVQLSAAVLVDAPAQQVFDNLTNWGIQHEWMLGTSVKATLLDGKAVNGGITAFTGLGPIGFTDTMVITIWDPPRRCSVRHTGRVVRGDGDFIVASINDQQSTRTWVEYTMIPFGVLGRFAWVFVKPLVRLCLMYSLKRFARWTELRLAR